MDDDNYNNSQDEGEDQQLSEVQPSDYDQEPQVDINQEDGADKDDDEDEENEEADQDDSDYEDQPENRPNVIDENDLNQRDEPNPQRITSPYMTKYQKARIIGVRAVQISKNAPIYIDIGDNMNTDPLSIAQRQLAQKKIPFIIRRYLPDGSYQHWRVSELKTFD